MFLDLDAILDPDREIGRIGRSADLPSDWFFVWEERAAIMEYDAKLPHDEADRLAFLDVLAQMRSAMPRSLDP